MDNITELITELKQNIQSCEMTIAGGNELNVLDALDSVTEIEQLIILRVSQQSELLQKIEMVKTFEWGIDAIDNERRMCELIHLL